MSRHSDSGSDDGGDWDSEFEDEPIASLLVDGGRTVASASAAWAELRDATGFDYAAWRKAAGVDGYGAVRLVNHIRRTVRSAAAGGASVSDALRAALAPAAIAPSAPMWADDALLLPVLEGDGLIMAVLADEDEDEEQRQCKPQAEGQSSGASAAPASAPAAPTDADARLAALSAELQSARALIARLAAGGAGGDDSDSDSAGSDSGDDGGAGASAAPGRPSKPAPKQKGPDNDTYYFDSYASAGIHRDMLRDAVRTDAYRDAITAHPAWFAGKTVLDVGCGTGILSMFSAQAQQRGEAAAAASNPDAPQRGHVIALDASGIVEDARAIVDANGLSHRITVVRGKAEEVDLPAAVAAASAASGGSASSATPGGDPRKCLDVIVSEWMGYALLYECMLDSVLVVRDAHLRPGGRMLPSRASIHVAAVPDRRVWHDKAGFWRDVYGFNLTQMGRHVYAEPYVEVLPPSAVAGSSTATLAELDLLHMARSEQDILEAPFALTVTATQQPSESTSTPSPLVVYGIALWFDIGFGDETLQAPAASAAPAAAAAAPPGGDDDLPPLETDDGKPVAKAAAPKRALPPPAVAFSTSPNATPTHWQQTLLLLDAPLTVAPAGAASGEVRGTLSMVRDATNPREYRFHLNVTATPSGARHSQSFHMR